MKYRNFAAMEKLSALGLGCMGMNHAYGMPDDEESLKTLHLALDLGINFWDTADAYANGKNESLISAVLKQNRDKVFIATKFGFTQTPDGKGMTLDGSPGYMKKAVEASLGRLGIDTIDLYYAHRLDPNIPIEEMVGAMAGLVKEGKVRYIGLSEVSAATLRRANAIHPISALQSEFSLLTQEPLHEIIPTCKEIGTAFIPFSPLSRGLMTNTVNLLELPDSDFRKKLPRYQESHAKNNHTLSEGFAQIAEASGCSPAQLALAWVLAQGDHIIPIPGTKKRKHLIDNAGAVDLKLTEEVLEEIKSLLLRFPDTGNRYDEASEKMVDK